MDEFLDEKMRMSNTVDNFGNIILVDFSFRFEVISSVSLM